MEVESVFMVDGADSFREAYFELCAVGREHHRKKQFGESTPLNKLNEVRQL